MSVTNVAAERLLGQDLLGLQQQNFKIKSIIEHNTKGTILGNLDYTFGTDLTKVKKLLTAIEPRFWRVHFINGPCIRNRNCGNYEYSEGLSISQFNSAVLSKKKSILNKYKERVQLYCQLKDSYPKTKFGFSPVLEHNLSPEAWNVLADVTLEICPGITLVNNAVNGVAVKKYKGSLIERHGTGNDILNADIVSTDGAEITDSNIPEYLKKTNKAEYVYSWSRVYNCRTNAVEFVDPRKRTACPNGAQSQLLAHIFDQREDAPKFVGKNCRKIVTFSSPWVNKPFSEDKGTGDQRANYPVIIIKDKSSALSVLDFKGNSVGTVGYYGTYDPLKGHRYYAKWRGGSNLSGYQYEIKARQSSGNPNTWLKAGNVCYGPVILGRRAGSFR